MKEREKQGRGRKDGGKKAESSSSSEEENREARDEAL